MEQREFNSRSGQHVTSPLCSTDRLDFCSSYPYNDPSRPRDALFFQSIPSALVGGIESYLDPKYITDPTTFSSRLPFLPLPGNYAMYDWGFEPAFIRKRNERERQRVKCVNEGYARLREHLPQEYAEKRLSKVETLRAAIQYIKHLQNILGIEQNVYTEKEDGEETSSKATLSPDGSDQDKLSEDNFAKYLEEEERFSVTPSAREEHSSSVDTEDSLVSSSLSPKVKVEVSSPSDFLQTFENSFHRQRSSCEFPLKGTIFCKTTQSNMKPQEFDPNWKQGRCGRNIEPHAFNACLPFSNPDINFHQMDQNLYSSMSKLNWLNSSRSSHILNSNESTSKTRAATANPTCLHNQIMSTQSQYWKRKQAKVSNHTDMNLTKSSSTSKYGTGNLNC